MTCKKCGATLDENALFCEECGTRVDEPILTPVAEENNQSQPIQQPKPPKKPVDKKKIVLVGCTLLVAIAIIVATVIGIKIAKTIDISNYVELNLENETFFDGYASAYVYIDEDKIEEEKLSKSEKDEESDSGFDLDNLKDLEDIDDLDSLDGYDLHDITRYCNVDASIKGSKSDEFGSSIYNLNQNDVIVVKISWDDSEKAQEKIDKAEDYLGIHFSQEEQQLEIKVSDVISKENIPVKTANPIDVFESFKECFYFEGLRDGEISFCVTEKTKVIGKYLVALNSNTIDIYSYDGTPDKANNYIEHHSADATTHFSRSSDANSTSELSVGDTVDVTIDDTFFEDIELVLTNSYKTFDVTKQEGLSVSQGKADVNNLKKFLKTAVKNDSDSWFSSAYQMKSIESIYLFKSTNDNTDYVNIVVAIVKNKDKTYTPYYAYNVVKSSQYSKTGFHEGGDEGKAKLALKQAKSDIGKDYKMSKIA